MLVVEWAVIALVFLGCCALAVGASGARGWPLAFGTLAFGAFVVVIVWYAAVS